MRSKFNEFQQPLIQECIKEVKTRLKDKPAKDRVEINVKIHDCWVTSEEKMYQIYSPKLIQKYLSEQMSSFLSLRKNTPVLYAAFSNIPSDDQNILKKRLENQPNVYFTNSVRDLSPDYRLFDYHPNKKGHQIITQDIFKFIIENKRVFCD